LIVNELKTIIITGIIFGSTTGRNQNPERVQFE